MGLEASKEYSVELIERLDWELIYSQYFPNFTTKKTLKSPFRIDRNPSFKFFRYGGKILWKDMKLGDSGNLITFVAKLRSISNVEAMKDILNNHYYNSPLLLSPEKIIERLNLSKEGGEETIEEGSNIFKFEERDLTKRDYEYWMKFNINSDILKEYRVFGVGRLYVRDILVWSNNIYNPVYGFSYNYKNNFKFYRPYAMKGKKWLSNCKSYVLQGYSQLDLKSLEDTLIITKAYKDVLSLRSFGVNSVAPSSESVVLKEREVNKLKGKYKVIKTLFDNDEAGVLASDKYLQLYKFESLIIPPNYEVKDFAEFVDRYGVNPSRDLLQTFLNRNNA